MLIGGLCCIAASYIDQGTTLATVIVMIGKFMIAGSFAVIYNYSAELFPTVIRNSGKLQKNYAIWIGLVVKFRW